MCVFLGIVVALLLTIVLEKGMNLEERKALIDPATTAEIHMMEVLGGAVVGAFAQFRRQTK